MANSQSYKWKRPGLLEQKPPHTSAQGWSPLHCFVQCSFKYQWGFHNSPWGSLPTWLSATKCLVKLTLKLPFLHFWRKDGLVGWVQFLPHGASPSVCKREKVIFLGCLDYNLFQAGLCVCVCPPQCTFVAKIYKYGSVNQSSHVSPCSSLLLSSAFSPKWQYHSGATLPGAKLSVLGAVTVGHSPP